MPYDEALAKRVRRALEPAADDVREQRMFGGLSFMLRGNMAVGVYGEDLIVRLDPATLDAALARPQRARSTSSKLAERPRAGCWSARTARRPRAASVRGSRAARSLPARCPRNSAAHAREALAPDAQNRSASQAFLSLTQPPSFTNAPHSGAMIARSDLRVKSSGGHGACKRTSRSNLPPR